jgi:hypothetical protein
MPGMSHVSMPLKIAGVSFAAALLLGGVIYALDAAGFAGLRALAPYLVLPLLGCSLVAAASLLTAIGLWIVGPLDRAARHRMGPTQFTMVDFLSLMFLFQLPMAALRGWASIRENSAVFVFYVFGWLATSAMWALSVRTLSRAGIEKTWHRGIFLALVLPAAYFGSIVFTAIVALGSISLFVRDRPWSNAPAMLVVAGGLLLAFFLSARFVRKMVTVSEAAREFSLADGEQATEQPISTHAPEAEADVDHP